jgi:hypothetical protein
MQGCNNGEQKGDSLQRIAGLFAYLLIFLAVFACSQNPSEKTPEKKIEAAKKAPETAEVVVGQPARLSDRTLTVNEVERNYAPPNEFHKPDRGNVFIHVNITLTNEGSSSFGVDPLNFEAEDSNGVRRRPRTMTRLPNRVSTGSLAPGGSLTGNLVLQVPRGDREVKLVYQPILTPHKTIIVNL